MCRRYVSVARVAELIEQYKPTGLGDDKQLARSYNLAPTNKVHAVLVRPSRRDGGNAGGRRGAVGSSAGVVETRRRPEVRKGEDHADAAQRPVRQGGPPRRRGRAPFAKRRAAVIPAAGYYEWLPTEDADGTRGYDQ
jgi:putative SOS response-associated peptidase YedK